MFRYNQCNIKRKDIHGISGPVSVFPYFALAVFLCSKYLTVCVFAPFDYGSQELLFCMWLECQGCNPVSTCPSFVTTVTFSQPCMLPQSQLQFVRIIVQHV